MQISCAFAWFALFALCVSGTTHAASLSDFDGQWVYAPIETRALLTERKMPDLADYLDRHAQDGDPLFLRVDTELGILTLVSFEGTHTSPFTVKELTGNRLNVSLSRPPSNDRPEAVLTLESLALLRSSMPFGAPVAFARGKPSVPQGNEAALSRLLGAWLPNDTGDWRVEVTRRKAKLDSDGLIRLTVWMDDFDGKKLTAATAVPFRIESATAMEMRLSILPAAPLVFKSSGGSTAVWEIVEFDLILRFIGADTLEARLPQRNGNYFVITLKR